MYIHIGVGIRIRIRINIKKRILPKINNVLTLYFVRTYFFNKIKSWVYCVCTVALRSVILLGVTGEPNSKQQVVFGKYNNTKGAE